MFLIEMELFETHLEDHFCKLITIGQVFACHPMKLFRLSLFNQWHSFELQSISKKIDNKTKKPIEVKALHFIGRKMDFHNPFCY